MRNCFRSTTSAAIAVLLLSLAIGCVGNIQPYYGGYAIVPEPQGDETEKSVERVFREQTGLWMGMLRGIAIDILMEKHGAKTGRQPSSGGVMTFTVPNGGYAYLLYNEGAPGSGKIYLCGLHLRGGGHSPPPLVNVDRIRAAIGGQNYRRTPDRVISIGDSDVLFLDREKCAHRDPGPPRGSRRRAPQG